MSRIRFVFPAFHGFYVAPEIICKNENINESSSDFCHLSFNQIKTLFSTVQNSTDFDSVSIVVQKSFNHSGCSPEIKHVGFTLDLRELCCDQIYIIKDGKVSRVTNLNPGYVQVHYWEQEDDENDLVRFDCDPCITENQVLKTIRDAQQAMPISEDEDRISWMDRILTQAAAELHAGFSYVHVAGCICVN